MLRRFRPYFHYFRPHRWTMIAGVIFGLINGLATGAGLPWMVKKVFPPIFAKGADPLLTWQLLLIVFWIPAVFSIRGITGYLNTYFIQLTGTRVLEALRADYFSKLQILPLSFFQKRRQRCYKRHLYDGR